MSKWVKALAVALAVMLMPCGVVAEDWTDAAGQEIAEELGEIDLPREATEPASEPIPETAEPANEPEAAQAAPVAAEKSAPAMDMAVEAPAPMVFPTALTLGAKERLALNGAEVFAGPVTYVSSNPKRVSVDENGVVTAHKKGEATITVYRDGLALAACAITVLKAPKKLAFPDESIVLSAGQSLSCPAILPKGAAGSVSYASDNPAAVVVDAAGCLYGVAGGLATVTATAYNGKAASCAVRVLAGPAPGWVALDPPSLALPVKGTARLSALYEAGCDAVISYATSNRKVATVDESGLVTAKKAGQATITATTHNGLVATCEVQVFAAPKKVTLNAKKLRLYVNDAFQLTAMLSKNSVSDISWTSDAPNVAEVDASGLVIALGAGEAKITATTTNGKKAACKVTVLDANRADSGGVLPIIGDSKNKLEIHFVSVGDVYDDVIILKCSAGAVLIDGGRERDGDRYGRTKQIHEYLLAIGVEKLDYVIGTHLDENHVGAAAWLSDHMTIGAAYYPVDPLTCSGKWYESEARDALLHAMKNTDVRVAQSGRTSIRLGKLEIYFIGTRREDFLDSPNSTSIVNLVKYGDNRFIFTGDQVLVGEPFLLAHMLEDASAFGFTSLKADMVKWPHHGNCNPGEAFWVETNPRFIVVPNNGKSDALDSRSKHNVRQNAPNAELLKLSNHDTITLVSDGNRIDVYYDIEPERWKS